MKKIRAGNDIQITWNIYAKNGGQTVSYDVTGAEVFLVDALKQKATFDYTIVGNHISGTFYGKDQKTMGKYRLLLVKNAGEDNMVTLDATDAFILTCVSKFGVVEGNDEGVVETAVVELDSQTNIEVISDESQGGIKTQLRIGPTDTYFDNWSMVYEVLQTEPYSDVELVLMVIYSGGLVARFYPTTIKHYHDGNTFISIHSKASSCELKVLPNGNFTVSGTKPW